MKYIIYRMIKLTGLTAITTYTSFKLCTNRYSHIYPLQFQAHFLSGTIFCLPSTKYFLVDMHTYNYVLYSLFYKLHMKWFEPIASICVCLLLSASTAYKMWLCQLNCLYCKWSSHFTTGIHPVSHLTTFVYTRLDLQFKADFLVGFYIKLT